MLLAMLGRQRGNARRAWRGNVFALLVVWLAAGAPAQDYTYDLPRIPVGLDAYRQWAKWPLQRIGVRSYMRSTYDRSGGNEGADASHFLYQERDDFNVALDVEGHPGVLYFVRTNHWHGSPWHYEVDGVAHTVCESSTASPMKPVSDSVFLPEDVFPNPLTWTWSATKGADLMWVPIPFERSLRLAYGRTRYGTGYYIYHQYMPGIPLSQPIVAWDGKQAPDEDVLELLRQSGTDIAPKDIPTAAGVIPLAGRRAATVFDSQAGPALIRAITFSVPRSVAVPFGRARLRITWDGREAPSVDAPVCLFFGAGTLYNRDGLEYLVKAFPVSVRYDAARAHLACYFPMPFFKCARIELDGLDPAWEGELAFEVRHEPYTGPPNHVGYFHATYRNHPCPERGVDLVLLDTRGAEREKAWSGSFVGTSFIFSHEAVLNTLEGDPRFFLDDCQTPSYGTGTEEWGGGGDYWGGRNMSLPFAGHPCGARDRASAKDPEDLVQSAYRFLLADLMPFGQRALIRFEHGGDNTSQEHYETIAYWYGLPGASLVRTDVLDVGDSRSEAEHSYFSPEASEPQTVLSRYEWGPDTVNNAHSAEPSVDARDIEVFPAHAETERHTTGVSEFTVAIEPDNHGILLCRTLDYAFPHQRAEVYVSDASRLHVDTEPVWNFAGIWYEAGSNTCYYSNPPGELDPPNPVVQTSNRRFRDSEFMIPSAFTQRCFALRIRIRFTPLKRPLLPGMDLPKLAWSEMRYQAYSYVMPPSPVASPGESE